MCLQPASRSLFAKLGEDLRMDTESDVLIRKHCLRRIHTRARQTLKAGDPNRMLRLSLPQEL